MHRLAILLFAKRFLRGALVGGILWGPALAGRASPPESPPQVLFWIRSGQLSLAEIDPDPDLTPRLRDLALGGVTVPNLEPPSVPPAGDPLGLAALFDAPVRAQIAERRKGEVVEVDGRSLQASSRNAGGVAAKRERWSHPVARELGRRFGPAPSPTPEEQAAVRRVLIAIGESRERGVAGPGFAPRPPAAPVPAGGDPQAPSVVTEGAVPTEGDPGALEIARRSIQALENGAPLVIARERVPDPGGVRERDLALGQAAAWAVEAGAVLMVLSAVEPGIGPGSPELAASGGPGEGPPRAVLMIAGRGVRSGRIIGQKKPLASAMATALEVLGVAPPPGREGEAIHALER